MTICFACRKILPYRISYSKEELKQRHADLIEKGLRVFEMDEHTVAEAFRLRQKYKKTSQNDINALALAKEKQCHLLTGDKNLRIAAENENHEVRGTLWLVERMLETGLVTKSRVEDAYARMKIANRRLPWDRVDEQLARF